MTAIIIVFIVLVVIVLVLLASYIIVDSEREKSLKKVRTIETSGVYSLIRESPAKRIRHVKPTREEVNTWLSESFPNMDSQERRSLVDEYFDIEERNIRVITVADKNSVETFGYQLSPKAAELCKLIKPETYITREMIHNHPELIPPFFVGDQSRIVAKESWVGELKTKWEPLLPKGGNYGVPDWRYLDVPQA